MAVVRIPGSTDRINSVLVKLFEGHGIEAVLTGDLLRFPAFPDYWMNGEGFNPLERAGQIDFRLGIAPGRTIYESVAGMGRTPAEQVEDGIQAFVSHSFHVLLCAFFGLAPDHGIDRSELEIGGMKRVVFFGTVGSRFDHPRGPDGNPDFRFFKEFVRLLKSEELSPGTHWVRNYQMRFKVTIAANEVLLDNAAWPLMQKAMAEFDWPVNEKHFDVRQFLVIRDPNEVSAAPAKGDRA